MSSPAMCRAFLSELTQWTGRGEPSTGEMKPDLVSAVGG